MLFDIHTHSNILDESVLPVKNLILGVDDLKYKSNSLYSLGFHPWYLTPELFQHDWDTLKEQLLRQDVFALGECGLDKLRGPELGFQIEVLEAQLHLADTIGKPVIIHSVKAFNELIQVLKVNRPAVPIVIHGFNNKLEIAQQLNRYGCRFSLGAALLKPRSNAEKVAAFFPVEQLFLETDDKVLDIRLLYRRLAEIKKISEKDVEEFIFANYLKLKI